MKSQLKHRPACGPNYN